MCLSVRGGSTLVTRAGDDVETELPEKKPEAEEKKAEAPAPALEYYSTADPRLSGGTVKEILGLFDTWNASLASGDPKKVADLYAPDGVLLPTVSNSVRADREGLVDYFTNFLKLKPQGVIDEYGIREEAVDANGVSSVISNSGIYTFTLGADGSQVQCRFTYVYKKIGDDWKILHHHSSQLPTKLTPSPFTGALRCLFARVTAIPPPVVSRLSAMASEHDGLCNVRTPSGCGNVTQSLEAPYGVMI